MNLKLKISNSFSPILEKIRYYKKSNPYDLFMDLRKNEILPDSRKNNVLILPIRVAPVSNLIEGVYGYAMNLRGYNVHGLFCNQHLNKCETINNGNGSSLHCSLCKFEQDKFSKTFEIIKHTYDELLDLDMITKLQKIALNTPIEDVFTLKYDDMLLGLHIKSAVLRYLMTNNVDMKKNETLIRDFIYSTLSSYESTKKLITNIKPKFVLSSHGIYSTWGGALEACKKLNIPVIVWGRGYVSGNLIVSYNESYAYECINEPNTYWENISLTKKEKEKISNYFIEKQNHNSTVDYINYYNGIKTSNKSIKFNNGRVKFGLFPNIPWDGTTFASTQGFPDMAVFLEKTIEWFIENQDYDLIIRVHPAERFNKEQETTKDLVNNICKNLPNNIFIIDAEESISSYDIAKVCDYCLIYASSIGLELAFLNKPVIQTGVFNTSNKGFTFEAKDKTEYIELLEKAAKKELVMTEEMKERVEKYAYHWIYKRHIPENTYEHKALTFTKYNLNSSMDLAPGKNKVVDWFIDRCEDGKPFIWEE
jgi:hypothetical protein